MTAPDDRRAAEQRYRALIDAVPVGIHQSDPDGECVLVNRRWSELCGRRAGEAAGRGWLRAIHPDDRARVEAEWRKVLASGRSGKAEYRFVRPDGAVVWVAGSAVAVRDEDGEPVAVLGVCVDVSERVRCEAQLERCRRYLELSRDLHVTTGFDGVFREVGGDVEEVLGWTADQMRGRTFRDFVHPDDRLGKDDVARLVAGRAPVQFVNRYRTREGGWRWLEWNAMGAPGHQLIYARACDLSGRLELEAGLERATAELEGLAEVAAHELEEPLRVVAGFLDLLARRYADRLDDDGAQFVSAALSGARRMQKLTRGLVEVARLGAEEPRFETVDTAAVVADVVHELRAAVDATGATVVAGELPVVRADREQLRRVLHHLIANAIKFCDAGSPRVLIEGRRLTGETWEISVTDNGIGIDPERAERAFELFRRLGPRDAYEGAGIGLPVCRRIVERHGGSIRVEPVDPHGSRFVFTLAAPPAGASGSGPVGRDG